MLIFNFLLKLLNDKKVTIFLQKKTFQLTTFEISNIGHVSVNVDGLGPLDWILETVVNFIADLIKDWVAGIVEGPLKDVIQGILNSLIPDIPTLMKQL